MKDLYVSEYQQPNLPK